MDNLDHSEDENWRNGIYVYEMLTIINTAKSNVVSYFIYHLCKILKKWITRKYIKFTVLISYYNYELRICTEPSLGVDMQ